MTRVFRNRLTFRILLGFLAAPLIAITSSAHGDDRLPNFVIIYADDLGYGDLGCFGHPTIRTPNLDQMAGEGLRFTQFYSAACVCTPSRAALMTGRLPIRNGMCSDTRRVLFPNSGGGIPDDEITLAEALKAKNYATGCFGKWHLGHLPQFLPTNNGFDTYFGIPYSNDMDRVADSPKGRAAFWNPKIEYWNAPLMRDAKIVERPADQTTITRRYTEQAVKFIEDHQDQPFFVYLPHSMVHVPLFTSDSFEGISARGRYGDCVEEVDWSVGQVLQTLKDLNLEEHTLVFFSSDNGPWLTFETHGGSAGLLRDGKGTTFEGGMREPTIAWWPGHIAEPGRVTQQLGSTMDIFTTCLKLADIDVPADHVIDGVDLSSVLLGIGQSNRDSILYYRGTQLMAARLGDWKAHFYTQSSYRSDSRERHKHDPPLLYHLGHDPSEQYNVNDQHAEVLKLIDALVKKHRQDLDAPPSQLDIPLASGSD